jgi:hypothetical protein
MKDPKAIFSAAEEVRAVLSKFELNPVVIGAIALAAHHYIRFTEDLDLGISADLKTLRQVAKVLGERKGFQVALREPDSRDPLSGVIDIHGSFGLVQIVNFGLTFPAVIEDAWRESTLTIHPGSQLRLAPLPHLIALKLYAGGLKSLADIVELLKRNPDADLTKLQAVCDTYRLKGLRDIIADLSSNER